MDWQDIAKHLWALLVPAGWWIWKKQDDRMNTLEAAMKEKADRAELDRQRDNISKIFDKIDGLKDDMNNKFDGLKTLLLGMKE